ncbi:MAG: hypothetical protein NT133_00120 [Alphaproteobacteria bacterium]|nr:hypothetical protein [Alphaproteobacteria bacterium]
MPNAEDVARQIAVHEAVCAERWKQTSTRLSRIEIVLGVIVVLLLVGEESTIDVLKRPLEKWAKAAGQLRPDHTQKVPVFRPDGDHRPVRRDASASGRRHRCQSYRIADRFTARWTDRPAI